MTRVLSQDYKVNCLRNSMADTLIYKENVCQMFADSVSSNDFDL